MDRPTRKRVARSPATVIDGSGARRSRLERLAGEEPLEIRVAVPGGEVVATTSTMRTPGQDFALAAGLLHAEGVIASPDDLAGIRYCTDVDAQQYNVVTVHLRGAPRRELAARTLMATASCGVCGTASIDELVDRLGAAPGPGVGGDLGSGNAPGGRDRVPSGGTGGWPGDLGSESAPGGRDRVPSGGTGGRAGDLASEKARTGQFETPSAAPVRFDPALLADLPERLRAAQPLFDETGGLHAAGLFDARGELLGAAEDVGRHNALDKVLGERFLAGGLPAPGTVAVLSGRVSFELVQKVAAARVPVICAVSAPSSLAVETAERLGITLAAFVRDGRLTVYSGVERLTAAPADARA